MRWAELSAAEVLAELLADRESGGSAQSGFLDTHQFAPLLTSRETGLHLDGGHPAAQFRRAALGGAPELALWTLDAEHLPEGVRSVRDLRGLLRRNLPDDAVGDILWGGHVALATTADTELDTVLPRARRTPEWSPPEPAVERATSAGPRVDSVVAPLFRVSRGEAQTAIEYGFVFRNFRAVGKRTEQVAAGDQLVFRTRGRIEIAALGVNQRSGRSMLEYHRFPA